MTTETRNHTTENPMLQQLSEVAGISGQEDAVRDIILQAIEPHVDEIRIDAMGSLLVVQRGWQSDARPRVMMAAHMDEIGFMVTGYDSDGLIRFTSVGGIDDRILPGLRVKLGGGGINGVIIWTPIHKNRDQNVVKQSNLRIDIGVSSKSEAEGKAPKGTMIVFDSYFGQVGDLWRGKAFDDRAGCAMLVELVQQGPYESDLLAAFTVQEEVGLRGATVAARAFKPDLAIAIETTTANDLPDPDADPDDLMTTPNPTCKVGEGPVLTVMDRSVMVNPKLVRYLRQTAEQNAIPYQLKTRPGGGTDAGSIQFQNGGVVAGTVSLPARYIHSPAALIHPEDFGHTVDLLRMVLNTVTPEDYLPE